MYMSACLTCPERGCLGAAVLLLSVSASCIFLKVMPTHSMLSLIWPVIETIVLECCMNLLQDGMGYLHLLRLLGVCHDLLRALLLA